MSGKKIGYVRVSTIDQSPQRQLEGVELDKKFTEYASGATVNREQLNLMIDYVREDDVILVHSMDRLARNVKNLVEIIEIVTGKGAAVFFVRENLKFTGDDSPISKLLLMLIGSVAQFERELMLERQREGIAIAQKAGKYKGRKPCMDEDKINRLKDMMLTRKSKSQIARDLGICRFSLYKYLDVIKQQEAS